MTFKTVSDPGAASRTEPNQGVKMEEIEAIVYDPEVIQRPWNVELVETVYFLHKDGYAYQGLGISPSDFNVEVSRQLESDKWTNWRTTETGDYEIFSKKNNTWEYLSGDIIQPTTGSLETPAVYGRHSRRFSNTDIMMDSISTKRLSVVLTEDGYFEISSSSMLTGGSSNTYITTSISVDGDGTMTTTSSASGGGTFIGSKNKFTKENSDNSGSYVIDGFTIIFYHDSGKVSRELFFIRGKDIFIGNRIYYLG